MYYYHRDHLGSVIGITDDLGNLIEQYKYKSYGTPVIYDGLGTQINSSSIENAFMFAGYYFDNESDLYYVRNRMYEPFHGRFLETDPLGYTDGLNLYEYVKTNPWRYTDPLGLFTKEEILAIWSTLLVLLGFFPSTAPFAKIAGAITAGVVLIDTFVNPPDVPEGDSGGSKTDDYLPDLDVTL